MVMFSPRILSAFGGEGNWQPQRTDHGAPRAVNLCMHPGGRGLQMWWEAPALVGVPRAGQEARSRRIVGELGWLEGCWWLTAICPPAAANEERLLRQTIQSRLAASLWVGCRCLTCCMKMGVMRGRLAGVFQETRCDGSKAASGEAASDRRRGKEAMA